MHSIASPPATVAVAAIFSFFIFFSVDVTPSFSLSCCSSTFTCGPLHNISYPFANGDCPAPCGPPEFRLSCSGGGTPEITIGSLSYRVLRVDSLRQTLTVARSDLWNEICPRELINTTMDSRYFSYGGGNTDLTMFYRCNTTLPNLEPVNRFWCGNNGWSRNDSYFLVGPVSFDPILQVVECDGSVRVPILDAVAVNLTHNRSLLTQALTLGFNVNYTIPFSDECSKCLDFGRQCGFDSNSSKPICICGDQVCSVPGDSGKTPKEVGLSSNGKRIIGIAAAVALGIFVSSIAVICYYKRECISSTELAFWKTGTRDQEFNVKDFIRNYESFAPKRFSYAAVKKMTNSFAEKIGKGGYGAVYKGKLPDGHLVAVKVLHESKTSNGEEFINEVASIGRTSHVNVVTLLGFCCERRKRALVYEYMPNGSLDKFIFNQESSTANCRLEWKSLYEIAVGIARGLEYLHQGCNTRILHFDIKPQNILLDKDFCPKISDFGLAKLWLTKESIVSMVEARGTIGYIAPEVFSQAYGRVSHKSDVYSYGMLILEMVGGRKNFDSAASHTSKIYFPNRIFKDLEMGTEVSLLGNIAEEEKEISRKMILVSFWCIQMNPADRPSMSKVVDMLEGSLESLEFPPKPYLFSPTRSP